MHDLLPLLDQPPRERSDAARNREALLAAAARLVEHCGVDAVTMDNVAAEAGVGKGTVFRRFDSREGLMAALLNRSETEFQRLVIRGRRRSVRAPGRSNGCTPSGTSRMEVNLQHAELIRAAGRAGERSTPRCRSPPCTCGTCSASSASAATSPSSPRPCSPRWR